MSSKKESIKMTDTMSERFMLGYDVSVKTDLHNRRLAIGGDTTIPSGLKATSSNRINLLINELVS